MALTKERQGEIALALIKEQIREEIGKDPLKFEVAEATVKNIRKSDLFLADTSMTSEQLLEFFTSIMPSTESRGTFEKAVLMTTNLR